MTGRTKKAAAPSPAETKTKKTKSSAVASIGNNGANPVAKPVRSKVAAAKKSSAPATKPKVSPKLDANKSAPKVSGSKVTAASKTKSEPKTKSGTKAVDPANASKQPSTSAPGKSPVISKKTTGESKVPSKKGAAPSKVEATAKPKKTPSKPIEANSAATNASSSKSKVATEALKNIAKPASDENTEGKKSSKSLESSTSKSSTTVSTKPASSEKPKAKKPKLEQPEPTTPPTDPAVVEKLRALQEKRERSKDLARPQDARTSLVHTDPLATQPPEPGTDRLVLLVRDPYWLHASWDISRRAVQRAKASLSGQWHSVKPILRLMHLDDSGTTANSEAIVRDIEIHSGVRNWYIPVNEPPAVYVAALGYLCSNGRFHELCRSNKVRTPVPGSNDAIDDHWADIAKDAERIYGMSGGYDEESHPDDLRGMFEERLNRPMSGPTAADFGDGADGSLRRARDFHFELDVEMVVFGSTQPYARLSIGGEPATVRSDGTFSAKVPMPNTRQVIPVTSRARDGSDEQTIVIAVERNTKVMEPVSSNNAEAED